MLYLQKAVILVRASQVALVVKNPPASAGDGRDAGASLSRDHLLEKGMATPATIPAWRILWTQKPGGL